MLALVATGATQSTDEVAAADAQAVEASVTQAKQLAAESNFRLEELIAFRDAQTADAERKRNELTHLQQHTDDIRQQLAQLNAEVEAALAQSSQPDDAPDIDTLQIDIAGRKQLLKNLQEQHEQLRRRVVIVPHRGPNGTLRRPIYLECGPDGLTIWPEGIQVSMSQLEIAATHPENVDANPLDVALRTARLHAMQSYGDSEPPYPMLVVRPDGIDAYAMAKAAMADWDDQYGYELVPSEIELAFPPADPVLAKSLQRVIDHATDVQSRLQRLADTRGSGRGGRSGPDREFPSAGKTPRVISAADLTSRGGLSGFRPDNEFRVQKNTTNLPAGDPLADFVNSDLEDRFSGSDASRSDRPRRSGTALDQRDGGTAVDALAQLHEAGGFEPSSDSSNGFQSDQPPIVGGQAASQTDQTGGQAADADQLAGEFTAGGTSIESLAANASPSGPQSSNRQSSNQAGGNSSQESNDAAPEDAPEPRPGDEPQRQTASSGASDQASDTPGGEQWALPTNVRRGGTNVIIRSMAMQITADTIRIGGQTIRIDPRSPSDANRQVVLVAQQTMKHWGPALAGGRWQPRLTAEVSADGVERSNELERYLHRSGIEFVRRDQTASRPLSPRQ